MFRALTGTLLALLLCARVSPGLAANAALTLETAVPAGFDDLTESRQLVVDIYYGGHPIGAARASVDLYTLRFEDPQALLQRLPPTRNPNAVLELLARPHNLNSHRVCRKRRQNNCGFLSDDNLALDGFGLIYDDSRFRADLFFAAELLPQRAALADPYLPPSSSGFSFMQNLSGSWSGVRTGDTNSHSASLFGQSILSFGEDALHGHWSAADGGAAQVYQLHWSRDYRGRAWSAGLIQPRAGFSSFVAAPYLYGLEFRSSENSRIDNAYSQGSPLEVHLPVRGRVEVHRDGRLLHSQLLEAGNQLLDTSALPGGAYELAIKVFDESGRPLEQYRQFFTKDSRLPAPGEWQWALQLGRPATPSPDEWRPQPQRDTFIQAGLSRRLFDNAGLFTNLAATEDQQLLELGARWVGEYLETSSSLIQSADGRSGHRLQALLKAPFATLNLAETRLQSPSEPEAGYRLLGSGYRQRNAGLNAPMLDGNLALRYSERDRVQIIDAPDFTLDNQFTSANHLTTLEYRRNLLNGRHWAGQMTLRHSEAGGERFTTASFEFRYREGDWSHRARLRGDSGDTNSNTRLGLYSNWHSGGNRALDLNQQFSAESAGDEYNLASHTRINGRRGQLSSTLNYLNHDDASSLNYLGSFSTSLIGTGESLAWGGERSLNSAVLVDIQGSDEEDFEILVDGVRRGYARGGSRSVVNLPAFRSYDIQLRPMGDGFYDYSEKRETITLYPGNVASAGYEVQPLILVLGRLLDHGEPVTQRKISIGEYSAVSDGLGVFQMEVYGNPRKLRSGEVRWGECRVPVPEQSAGEHWLNLGDIEVADCE